MKSKTFVKLMTLCVIGTSSIMACIGIEKAGNSKIKTQSAINEIDSNNQIDALKIRFSDSGYTRVEQIRMHAFNIKTIFDGENDINQSLIMTPNKDNLILYYKNNNNYAAPYAYCYNTLNNKNDGESIGQAMNFIQDDIWYLEIPKFTYNKVVFSDKGDKNTKTPDIDFDGFQYTSPLYDNGWKSLKTVEDHNSSYFHEAVKQVYTNHTYATLYDEIKRQEITLKATYKSYFEFEMPWYVTSFDLDVVAMSNNNKIKSFQSRTIAKQVGKGTFYTYYFDKHFEHGNPIKGVFEPRLGLESKVNKVNATQLDKFLLAYSKAFKHDSNNSICTKMFDINNKNNILKAIEEYDKLNEEDLKIVSNSLEDIKNNNRSNIKDVILYAKEVVFKNLLNYSNFFEKNFNIFAILIFVPSALLISLFVIINKKKIKKI